MDTKLISVKLYKKVEFNADFFSVEMVQKIFYHVHFFPTFSTDTKSASNPGFFCYLIISFSYLFLCHIGNISTFCKL